MDRDFVIEQLRASELFGGLTDAALHRVAEATEPVHVTAGGKLTTQGEVADGAYLLISGRLRAYAVQSDGSESVLGEIAAGEVVGEMALLSAATRTATVRAVRDSQLLFFRGAVFTELMATVPGAAAAMATVLVERLERANRRPQSMSPRRAVALVPAFGDCTAPIRDIADALRRAEPGSRVVTEADAIEACGTDRPENEMVRWLHEVETSSDLVIYLADDLTGTWAHRCLRQADHIVAVDASPDARREQRVVASLAGMINQDVAPSVAAVCVHHPGVARPTGAGVWTSRARIPVHHVRRGNPSDLGRLCRSILRRDIGLVLSGGGARGMAHVGVLRAFEERGIPVDVTGGSSFGGIVAMFRSLDLSWQEIREVLWETVGRPGAPVDPTPPVIAVSRGIKLANVLSQAFGDATIENSWLRTFCVASNLSTGHPLVLTSGPMATALRASVAIPGVFPPVSTADGEVVVDGGVMNNLPVDVMADFSDGGPIIAVNLRAPAELAAGELPADGVVSGWGTIARRLNPFSARPQMPSLVEVLARSSEVGGTATSRLMEQRADFVLHPPSRGHALLEFGALDDLIAGGYEYTMAMIDSWEADGRSLP